MDRLGDLGTLRRTRTFFKTLCVRVHRRTAYISLCKEFDQRGSSEEIGKTTEVVEEATEHVSETAEEVGQIAKEVRQTT